MKKNWKFGLVSVCMWSATATAAELEQVSLAIPGEPLMFQGSWNATVGQALLVRGTSGGQSCPVALGGECLSLGAPRVMATIGNGGLEHTFELVVPGQVPVGASTGFQLALPDINTVSNAVEITLQDDVPGFGVWVDNFGTNFEIDNQTIASDYGSYHIEFNANATDGRVIAQNDITNAFNPGDYSAFDFVTVAGTVWMCQTAYDAPTADDAAFTTPPNPSNPSVDGCGLFNFPWTPLTPADVDIAGSYLDQYGSGHTVDSATWLTDDFAIYEVSRFSNADQFIIAQNDGTNGFAPGLWSRFDWTVTPGGVYYCQSAYDAPSEYAARMTPAADASSPATGGCGVFNFAWTLLGEPTN